MKFVQAAVALLTASSFCTETAGANADACVQGGFRLSFDGYCNYTNFIGSYEQLFENSGCAGSVEEDLAHQFDVEVEDLADKVDEVCHATLDASHQIPFEEIAMKNGPDLSFETRFYNGDTEWNQETETKYPTDADGQATNVLRQDAKRVRLFHDNQAQINHVSWPGSISNFDLDTCTTSAAMCCWPRDRQANDNNGNCATPYDENCVDKGPGDNTDLCYVDLAKGQNSTNFGSEGTAVFPDDDGNVNDGQADAEGRIHCHGFAWSNDPYDFTARYKANNLFFVSMYDHMHQRGYVENIAGAAMCACVEQMPVVTRSDCTQIDVEESFLFQYDPTTSTFSGEVTDIEIDFNGCKGLYNQNNDLWAYMGRLYKEKKVSSTQYAALAKVLVEDRNCPHATRYHFEQEGYKIGYEADNFQQVAGKGQFAWPSVGKELFEDLMEGGGPYGHGMVLRTCLDCEDTHKFIYYVRKTEIPDGIDLLHELKNERNQHPDNLHKTDFELYSTYEDAVANTNAWICEYNYNDYFPGTCAPNGQLGGQGARFESPDGKKDVAFYAETDETYTDLSEYHEKYGIGFTSLDIGEPTNEGNTVESSDGTIHQTTYGYDIWSDYDRMQFAYQEVPADTVTLVVHVTSMDNNNKEWAKGGLMIRENLTPGSENAFVYLSGKNGVQFQTRPEESTPEAPKYTNHHRNYPYTDKDEVWLMLTKNSQTFRAYESGDGQDWELVENEHTFPDMFKNATTLYVGLAASAADWWMQMEVTYENYTYYDQASNIKCVRAFE